MKWIFLLLLLSVSVYGREDRTLGRSARGLLMGDAYTAIADDEFTLYYNPALLARHENFSFNPINPAITVTNALNDPSRFSSLGSDPTDVAGAVMNYPIHMGMSMAPGLKMGKFGMTAIINNQTNITLQNQITPMMDVDYRFDKGFIAGFAMPLSGSYSSEKGGSHFAMGASVKYIQREAVYGTYNLTGTSLLDALSAGDLDAIISELGQVKGSGWGFDLGFDWAKSSGASKYMVSLAILDPFTILHTEDNPKDKEVQPQYGQVNLGAGWELELGAGFDLTLSLDLRNIHQIKEGSEYQRDLKVGLEVGTPVLRALAGINSGYYTYGIQTNLFLINTFLGFYDLEIGEKLGQQRASRALIYFSLFDFTFAP
jgi:hypothetical protein